MDEILYSDSVLPRLRYQFCPMCREHLKRRTDPDNITRVVCPACGWTHYPTNALGVNVVVRMDDGLVALLPPEAPAAAPAALPGGHVEYGESPEQAAIREAHEETGLIVEVLATGIPDAGAINRTLLVEATSGRYAYRQRERQRVEWEHAIIDHAHRYGLPVPRPLALHLSFELEPSACQVFVTAYRRELPLSRTVSCTHMTCGTSRRSTWMATIASAGSSDRAALCPSANNGLR